MNYKNIYKNLIERAKNRMLDDNEYVERHHIVPKCLGGNNSKNNIVKLYPKEHYIAHLLLYRIHPNHQGLAYSFWMMCNGNRKNKREYKVSGRLYEEIFNLVGTFHAGLHGSGNWCDCYSYVFTNVQHH